VKKFIFRGFIFISIGLILLFVLNALYVRTNGYKSLGDSSRFFVDSNGLDVVNLGISHGQMAFDYSEIDGTNGANFGNAYQGFYYDFEILKEHGRELPEGCTVIMPISDISFDLYKDIGNLRIQYYRILDYGAIPNHDPVEYLKLRLLPILTAKYNIKYIFKDKNSPEDQVDAIVQNQMDEGEFLRNAQEQAGKSKALHERDQQTKQHEENQQMNIDKLGEMIEYCQERGYKPVLVTTPFTRYYNESIPEEYYTEMYGIISDVSKKYGIPYLDYSHDPRFTERLEYFRDADHMNPLGARAFTDIVLSDLGII
jgi:hypothetical protein